MPIGTQLHNCKMSLPDNGDIIIYILFFSGQISLSKNIIIK